MEWLLETYPDNQTRDAVLLRHDLGTVPESAVDFLKFYRARRDSMKDRLIAMLSVRPSAMAAAD